MQDNANLHQDEPSSYLTTPPLTDKMPGGIPYIVGNEAAERFSYYGMRAILAVFLTTYLMDVNGELAPMDENRANEWQHNFSAAVYFLPLFGAMLSDFVLGKYRTIILLSIVYCAGHAVMALVDYPQITGVDPRKTLFLALALIALGSGGIKPCVSAHVGDQFGAKNKHLMAKIFSWFLLLHQPGIDDFHASHATPARQVWTGRGVRRAGRAHGLGHAGVLAREKQVRPRPSRRSWRVQRNV